MFTYQNITWSRAPNPGELRHRICIVSPVTHVSDNGYPVTEDEMVCAAWARVEQSGDSMNVENGVNAHAAALNFSIRWRDDIAPGMVVIFEGARYEITALGQFDFKKRYLGMKTQTTRVMAK